VQATPRMGSGYVKLPESLQSIKDPRSYRS